MTEIPATASRVIPYHDYHAKAHVLSGYLKRPIDQKIEEQSAVSLDDRRGGHFTRSSTTVSIEGLVSFTKGETRVSGSHSLKTDGWVTLSTSILEGLKVFDVITADRVVSQVSTEHAKEGGHFPDVTFLGTQFTNLRVSGFPVTFDLNLGICGKRPEGNRSYLQDSTFLSSVRQQTEKIAKGDGLPKELKARYDEKLKCIDMLIGRSRESAPNRDEPKITCSLVDNIGEIPIPGVTSYGHILVIPNFGSVALGEIEVGEKIYKDDKENDPPSVYFELTGINMKLGCVGDGAVMAATALANGRHKP
jgi:hypothetical protein